MGGFMTGLLGELGKQVQAHHERNVNIQQQAQEEQAKQYDRMAQDAQTAGKWDLAADLHKASFGIRTTLPGAKVKAIKTTDGRTFDPMDMQGIIAHHTNMEMQRQAQAAAPAQPLAPNGVTPQPQGQQQQSPGSGYLGMPDVLQKLTPPPPPNLPGGPTIQNAQSSSYDPYWGKQ